VVIIAFSCVVTGQWLLMRLRLLPDVRSIRRTELTDVLFELHRSCTCSRRLQTANRTRRPASADRTARRQFQATGQPISRTQASDAMTSRLPRYEAKCVQRRCFQCRSVPLRSDNIKGTELPPANILISLERQLTALQLCR